MNFSWFFPPLPFLAVLLSSSVCFYTVLFVVNTFWKIWQLCNCATVLSLATFFYYYAVRADASSMGILIYNSFITNLHWKMIYIYLIYFIKEASSEKHDHAASIDLKVLVIEHCISLSPTLLIWKNVPENSLAVWEGGKNNQKTTFIIEFFFLFLGTKVLVLLSFWQILTATAIWFSLLLQIQQHSIILKGFCW